MMTVFSERNQGWSRKTLDDELLVARIANNGGGSLYQLYDQDQAPAVSIPLPPWDYEAKSDAPRHNYTMLSFKITEIRDLPWLIANASALWPNYEYEATPAFHIEAESPRYDLGVRGARSP
jgi:hypothetical protein